jgi:hypothetical protein
MNSISCRETDETPSREEIALPPTEKDKEEHFKHFFHSVSGEVNHRVCLYELINIVLLSIL